MHINDLPSELWHKIYIYIQEPEIRKGWGGRAHESGGFYLLSENGYRGAQPTGLLQQIDAKYLYPLLLVSKRCYTLTMSYLWSKCSFMLPQEKEFSSPHDAQFQQHVQNDILIKDPDNLYSSSLSFVTHYYISASVPNIQLLDRPNTDINPYMLANPIYMPNLKLLAADLTLYEYFNVEASLIGTTYYTEPPSITLTANFQRIEELASSLAKPALLQITSLILYTGYFRHSDTSNLPSPELRSIDIINQMLSLKEFSVIGAITSQKYFEQVLSCKPSLNVLNLGWTSWLAPIKYIKIGQAVTEFCCRSDVFTSIIHEKALLPNVKKLFVEVCNPSWKWDIVQQETFTNLEEFMCIDMPNTHEPTFNLCVTILQSNPGLRHFSLRNFDPDLWDHQAKHKFAFPNLSWVRLLDCQGAAHSRVLNSFFKIFPSCGLIEVTTSRIFSVEYHELKQFALANPSSRHIMIKITPLVPWSPLTPYTFISGFTETYFDVNDFCFSVLPSFDYPMLVKYRELMRSPDYADHIKPCLIDVQALQRKIAEFSTTYNRVNLAY